MSRKNNRSRLLLIFIIFLHFISIICSAYYEKGWQISNYHNYIKLNTLKYWLIFFTRWSAYTSLLTMVWAGYKLLSKKENKIGQLSDVTITLGNIISGIVYCAGGFKFSYPKFPNKLIPYPLIGEVKAIHVYFFYHFLWHFLAPLLVFYYFKKYSRINRIEKNRKRFRLISLINPLIYFTYVVSRPLLTNNVKFNGPKPYNYPSDYPYFFFFWSTGKFASRQEEKNKPFFWHHWPVWLQSLFWTLVIIFFSYIVFTILFNFLINFKRHNKNFK